MNLRQCQIKSLERGNDRVRVEKLTPKVEVFMSAMTTFSALKMRKRAVSLRKLRLVSRRRTWPDCEISQRSRRIADTHFITNRWISSYSDLSLQKCWIHWRHLVCQHQWRRNLAHRCRTLGKREQTRVWVPPVPSMHRSVGDSQHGVDQ